MGWSVYVVDPEAEISTFIDEYTDEGDALKAKQRALEELEPEDVDSVYVEIRES
jgi:hypothetical protein